MTKRQLLRLLLILVTVLGMYALAYWAALRGPVYHAHNAPPVYQGAHVLRAPAQSREGGPRVAGYVLFYCVHSELSCQTAHWARAGGNGRVYDSLSACEHKATEFGKPDAQGRYHTNSSALGWYQCQRAYEYETINSKPA